MKAKYDVIGIDYNLTRKADPYLVSRFLALLNPNPKGQYLDIGCGTGNSTSEFQK
ncbi:MAG: class I SAM-dependent methyltransferase, partial [Flavobacteriales bacterium]|nr:class I SAM-dependent methyltransferase [Flavobacteriales bacterium]